jgi:hypothetical protein
MVDIADMSKGPAKKQSFKDLVEEAKDIGVSPNEVRHIQKVVKSHRFPADVQAVELNFGRDWTGAPAAWIEFLVEDDLNPSEHKITRLNEFVSSVRRDLLRTKPVYWPYVGFRAAS